MTWDDPFWGVRGGSVRSGRRHGQAIRPPGRENLTQAGQAEVSAALGARPAGDVLPIPFSDPPQVAAMLADQIGGQVGVYQHRQLQFPASRAPASLWGGGVTKVRVQAMLAVGSSGRPPRPRGDRRLRPRPGDAVGTITAR
jgi:hypothetical protein